MGEAGLTSPGPGWLLPHHLHLPKWDKALSSCSLEGEVLSTFQPCHLYLSADLIPLGMIMITLLTGQLSTTKPSGTHELTQPSPQARLVDRCGNTAQGGEAQLGCSGTKMGILLVSLHHCENLPCAGWSCGPDGEQDGPGP